MIKGVIFDMDGVLVDNSAIHVEAFVEWCRRRNVAFAPEDLKNLFGLGNDDILRVILNNENLTKEEIDLYANEKEAIYREMFETTIEPMGGLVVLLKQLKERGVKIAVGSSGMRKNVNFVLERCGITSYFDAIADGDMVVKAKPDPEVFLKAASLLGLEPAECLVFEDSFAGVKAARAAGMKVVVLTTTYAAELHGDYDDLIADFTEIDARKVLAF